MHFYPVLWVTCKVGYTHIGNIFCFVFCKPMSHETVRKWLICGSYVRQADIQNVGIPYWNFLTKFCTFHVTVCWKALSSPGVSEWFHKSPGALVPFSVCSVRSGGFLTLKESGRTENLCEYRVKGNVLTHDGFSRDEKRKLGKGNCTADVDDPNTGIETSEKSVDFSLRRLFLRCLTTLYQPNWLLEQWDARCRRNWKEYVFAVILTWTQCRCRNCWVCLRFNSE